MVFDQVSNDHDADGHERGRRELEPAERQEDVRFGELGQEHPQELREGDRDRSNGAGLDDQEQGPAVEETRQSGP